MNMHQKDDALQTLSANQSLDRNAQRVQQDASGSYGTYSKQTVRMVKCLNEDEARGKVP